MQNWISCDEQLPPDGHCLCYNRSNDQVGEYFYDSEDATFALFTFSGEHVMRSGSITHWMPLPEAPVK